MLPFYFLAFSFIAVSLFRYPLDVPQVSRHNFGHTDSADTPLGTLISPCFRIVGRDISFLIGGGCTISDIRAELIVNNQVRLFTLTIMFHLITLKQPG